MISPSFSDAPGLQELARLSLQIERDRELDWSALHERDAAIGSACVACESPSQRLLCWLDRAEPAGTDHLDALPAGIGPLLSAVMVALGFSVMVGFLLAHPTGQVNLLWFLALFVFIQIFMVLLSSAGLLRLALGRDVGAQWLQPGRWLFRRSPWAARLLRESSDLVQLMVLHQGQLLGAAFMAGALMAFLLTLFANPFSFAWGSTYALGEDVVNSMVQFLSAPWSGWLSAAAVDPQLVADSRVHAGSPGPSAEQALRSGRWWPFLLMVLISYTLLPRLFLWLVSGGLLRHRLLHSFTNYPGADLVLLRLAQAALETRGEAEPLNTPQQAADIKVSPGTKFADASLVNWGDAVARDEFPSFAELQGLGSQPLLLAGLSLIGDEEALQSISAATAPMVLILLKSWEPPMADLADFIDEAARVAPCILLLRPLRGQMISREIQEDWRRFAAQRPGTPAIGLLTECAGIGDQP